MSDVIKTGAEYKNLIQKRKHCILYSFKIQYTITFLLVHKIAPIL